MNTKRHKLILTLISVTVLAAISITAVAVNQGKKPSVTAGNYQNLIADRIDLSLENTEFTLNKSSESDESYTLTFYLTAKKTQGDFYAVINSFSVTGIAYDNLVFTALSEKAEGKTLDSLMLTAENGEPDEYKWQIDMTLSIIGKGEYMPVIKIDYTSGMTAKSAQHKLTEIPLTITVK